MDTELVLLLKGHGLYDFVTDDPECDGTVQIEVCYADSEVAETLYADDGLGEQVLNVIGDWLDGHSEFMNTYEVIMYGFEPPSSEAVPLHIRAASALSL